MMNAKEAPPDNARPEQEIFADLAVLCTSAGYIHAIAYFCCRDNLIRSSGDQVTEDDMQHQYSHDKLLTTEISTLIGLMAKEELNVSIPPPEVLNSYIDNTEALLHEMHMSLQKPWVESLKALALDPEHSSRFDPFNTADGLREPIFYSGESAYHFQYEALAQKKYQADNQWLKSNKGFAIDEACLICRTLGELLLQKQLNLRQIVIKLPPDQWTFLHGFTFFAEELVTPSGFELQLIERILDEFCFDPGQVNATFTSLSEFNESNATPIIRRGDGSYILLQHYSLLEALYEAPFYWMAADKSYSTTASLNRGEFAEQFIAERLTSVFAKKHVFRNIDIYKGKDRVTEVDVLVLYGDRAIVVQAKSKRLTIEARKGNDLQLRDDFKKAIQDAYDQAALCSEALLDENFRFVDSSGHEFTIQNQPKIIYPVCAVSDHFPALAAQVRQFLKTKSSPSIQPPIITDVFFIDVVTELLETPLHLLNYFALRTKFDDRLLVSQELTNLGYHLKHNLWLDDQYDLVNLGDDLTASLDIAMTARRLDVPGEKTPKGILTRFDGWTLGRLLSDIEDAATPELVGLGMLFLQLGSDAAKQLNTGIDHLVRVAQRDGNHYDMSVPREAESAGFTIHTNSLPEVQARNHLLAHCEMKKYDTKSNTWYGLLLAPGSGAIVGALVLERDWEQDQEMDNIMKSLPRRPLTPLAELSSSIRKRKIGRNEPCPCGSGKKHKKCCLD